MKRSDFIEFRLYWAKCFFIVFLAITSTQILRAEGYRYDVKNGVGLVPFKIANKQFYADVRVTRVSSHINFLLLIVYNRKPKFTRTLYDTQDIAYFQPGTVSYYPDNDKTKKKIIYLDQDIEYCSDSNNKKLCDIPEFSQVLIKQHADRASLTVKKGSLRVMVENYGSTVLETKPVHQYYFWKWDGVKFVELPELRKKIILPAAK